MGASEALGTPLPSLPRRSATNTKAIASSPPRLPAGSGSPALLHTARAAPGQQGDLGPHRAARLRCPG